MFFSSLLGGIGSSLGGMFGSMFGGGKKGGGVDLQPLLDAQKQSAEDAGIRSALQGSEIPGSDPAPTKTSGTLAGKLGLENITDSVASAVGDGISNSISSAFGGIGSAVMSKLFGGKGSPKSAGQMGQDTRDYLAAAFPEMNPWERAGAGASGIGGEIGGQDNAIKLAKMQNDTQKDIAHIQANNQLKITKMQNDTADRVAGIQSVTSRENTKDQVYAQNEMLSYQQNESNARLLNVMQNTSMSKTQQAHELTRILLTEAQTAGAHLSNYQTVQMTDKIKQEIYNMGHAQSVPGRMFADGEQIIERIRNAIGDWWNDGDDSYKGANGVSGPMSGKPIDKPSNPYHYGMRN